MTGIVEWVKNYSMAALLLTVLTSISAKKEYKKYIRLFVEIIFVIMLANPLLQILGKAEDLFEKTSYDSFWQGLESIQKDREKIDFLQDDYYIAYYEKAIEADVKLLAESFGYGIPEIYVTLNETFAVETMELKVVKQKKDRESAGAVLIEQGEMELAELKEKIAAYYEIEPDNISITD